MRIQHGKKINYEDDVVVVYNEKGEIVYKGIVDYCPYKDTPYIWNKEGGYYELQIKPDGYTMVCIG